MALLNTTVLLNANVVDMVSISPVDMYPYLHLGSSLKKNIQQSEKVQRMFSTTTREDQRSCEYRLPWMKPSLLKQKKKKTMHKQTIRSGVWTNYRLIQECGQTTVWYKGNCRLIQGCGHTTVWYRSVDILLFDTGVWTYYRFIQGCGQTTVRYRGVDKLLFYTGVWTNYCLIQG